ncbi:MAG: hypothetical protein KDD48_02385 [Bdellovibrionales bacterium]|nr:hypothetical protein [Bdellovibrionales bacterium]
MKNKTHCGYRYLSVLIALFAIFDCGTEIGNPGFESDFNNSLGFVAASSKLETNLNTSLTTRSQISSDSSRSITLYKYTTDGILIPVISTGSLNPDAAPYIENISSIDGTYYIQFSESVDLGDGSCILNEVVPPKNIRCIDSATIPAQNYPIDNRVVSEITRRNLFVAKDPSGDLYYLSKSTNSNVDLFGSQLAVLHTNGTRERVTTNPNHFFSSMIQGADGTLYAFYYSNIIDNSTTPDFERLHFYCKLENGTCTSMLDTGLTPKEFKYIPLSNGTLLFDSYDSIGEPFHLTLGSIGQLVNSTNFNIDLKLNLGPTPLSEVDNIQTALRTSNGNIYALQSGSSPKILQLAPTYDPIDLPNSFPIVDYRDGGKIIMAFVSSNIVQSLDPETNELNTLNFPAGKIFSLRYVADDVVLFSILNSPSNSNEGNLSVYRYIVSQDNYELLLDTDSFSYLIAIP